MSELAMHCLYGVHPQTISASPDNLKLGANNHDSSLCIDRASFELKRTLLWIWVFVHSLEPRVKPRLHGAKQPIIGLVLHLQLHIAPSLVASEPGHLPRHEVCGHIMTSGNMWTLLASDSPDEAARKRPGV